MDWKQQLSLVYSTDKDVRESIGNPPVERTDTTPPAKQSLRIALDRHNRRGKQVTVVADFKGGSDALEQLCRTLKQKLGVGGCAKDGEIVIQGDFRTRVQSLLQEMGYKARVI